MSDYDSNYYEICCPYCKENINNNKTLLDRWVDDLENEEEDFFQCQKCNKFFKAELSIYTEYTYTIRKPTKEEIKNNNFDENKEIIEDVPGQTLMWKES